MFDPRDPIHIVCTDKSLKGLELWVKRDVPASRLDSFNVLDREHQVDLLLDVLTRWNMHEDFPLERGTFDRVDYTMPKQILSEVFKHAYGTDIDPLVQISLASVLRNVQLGNVSDSEPSSESSPPS